MRKQIGVLSVLVLLVGVFLFFDTIRAYVVGVPIRLVSATGSLDPALPDFNHAFLRNGNLNLVIRTFFYDKGTLAQPYITVDKQQNGVLHIGIKPRLTYLTSLLSKCEYLRQFEVEIPENKWKQLRSLQVYNHNAENAVTEPMQISNPVYLGNLLRESQEQLAVQDLTGVGSGC